MPEPEAATIARRRRCRVLRLDPLRGLGACETSPRAATSWTRRATGVSSAPSRRCGAALGLGIPFEASSYDRARDRHARAPGGRVRPRHGACRRPAGRGRAPSASAPTTTWSGAAATSWRPASGSNDGAGVILLTDMFGGTPSNLAISVMEQTKAEVIAGLNLPMLIKLASVRAPRGPARPASPRPRKPAANTSPSPPTCWRARNERPWPPKRRSRSPTSAACTPAPRPSSSSWPPTFDAEVTRHQRRRRPSTPARSWA